jgi:hypothetical protein
MSEYDDSHMLSKTLERIAAQAKHLKEKIDLGLEIPSWAEYKVYSAYDGIGKALGTAYPGSYGEAKLAADPAAIALRGGLAGAFSGGAAGAVADNEDRLKGALLGAGVGSLAGAGIGALSGRALNNQASYIAENATLLPNGRVRVPKGSVDDYNLLNEFKYPISMAGAAVSGAGAAALKNRYDRRKDSSNKLAAALLFIDKTASAATTKTAPQKNRQAERDAAERRMRNILFSPAGLVAMGLGGLGLRALLRSQLKPPPISLPRPKFTLITRKISPLDSDKVLRHPDGDLIKESAATATKTDPQKWEQAKAEARAKMGGKHSARAMQLATKIYKDKGGGYSGAKPSASNNSLKKWTKQDWKWTGGDKPGEGGRGVYLPKQKADRLRQTEEGKDRLEKAARQKREATRQGEQYSSHGLAANTSLKK